jgi:hypothetical protein
MFRGHRPRFPTMKISDAIISYELPHKDAEYLNDFLADGWRIIETRKAQVRDFASELSHEEIVFILGSIRKQGFPARYRAKLKGPNPFAAV